MDSRGENSGDSVELKNVHFSHFLTVTDPTPILVENGASPFSDTPNHYQDAKHPYVEIVEQPQQRGFRFRYECEGPSHGGLQGLNTERNHKVYPSIRVVNYEGPAQIEVSLVTDEDPPRIHAHKLVGKNCVDGVCKLSINSTASIISLPNLCIQHVTKKKAADVLLHRILEEDRLRKEMAGASLPSQPQPAASENVAAKKQAQDLARNMSLNAVRLQFRVFLPNTQGQYLTMLTPVVSQPIYDSKSPGASTLKICRMDKYGGCCTGNEEVFLLCERVQKEDIQVRFVEQDSDGNVLWEAYGNFSPLDVHRQYAIVFKTPAYNNPNIERAVNVMIMLQRKSDSEVSQAMAFTYYPQNRDKDLIARKKRKKLPLDAAFNYYNDEGGPGGGAAGQGNGMGSLFGPLGPDIFGGGSGGGMEQNHGNYSVMLPNGNIVNQLNVLPETVEQAVKEEFSNSPAETFSLDDLVQEVMENPMGTIVWTEDNFNDLEMDAAPSLRHPSQLVITTGSVVSAHKSKPSVSASLKPSVSASLKPSVSASLKKEDGGHDRTRADSGEGGKLKEDICNSRSQKNSGSDKRRKESGENKCGKESSGDKQRKDDGDVRQQTGMDPSLTVFAEDRDCSTFIKDEGREPKKLDSASHKTLGSDGTGMTHCDQLTAFAESDSMLMQRGPQVQRTVTLIIDSQEASQTASIQHDSHSPGIPPRAESGEGREQDDSVASSARMNEVGPSESARTDEGFSEVSEVSSGREDIPELKKTHHVPPPLKTKGKQEESDVEDVSSKPVKVATSVVKRIIQKITAKTVLALRDYSETGDPRYLLLVQRHLTAIRNENGDLPLHLAVINNQTIAQRHLLAVMMSLPGSRRVINTFNYIRQTALHLAAIMQQPVSMEVLLHAGADPSLADRNGNTPAHLAVLNSSLEGLRSLIKYLRPGVTAANPFPELDYLNYDGYSPVHLAAQMGSVDMLRLLVHGQADVDLGDGKSGRTALHHAVEQDDLPVAGFLLMEANADVNARCFDGNTPLHIACCKGLIGMVALLMTAGALTDVENEEIPSEEDDSGEGAMEEEKEDEGVAGRSPRCRRGLQPRDYACGKDRLQILRMLMGDNVTEEYPDTAVGPEYFDDPDLAVDPDFAECGHESEQDMGGSVTHTSAYDRAVIVSHLSQSASVPPVNEKLSHGEQAALSRILDPARAGKDVFELACRLGYDSLVPALEVMASCDSSPTLYLLDYNETYGSLAKLRECLQDMELDEALKVLDRRT